MEHRRQLGPTNMVCGVTKAVFSIRIAGITTPRSYNDGLIGTVKECNGPLFVIAYSQGEGMWQAVELFDGNTLAVSRPHFFYAPGSATIIGQADYVAIAEEYPLAFQAIGEVCEVAGNTAICTIFAGTREITINIEEEEVEVGEELLLTVYPTGDMIMADHRRRI